MSTNVSEATHERAASTKGTSGDATYRMVARTIAQHVPNKGLLLDFGCGTGALRQYVAPHITEYAGIDAVRYDGFPTDAQLHVCDLDKLPLPIPDIAPDIVTAVEVIEHVENPRALVREMTRLCKPGGLVLVTTPNQLSFLSKLTFLLRNQFNAFQEAPGLYPAHITALLEIDLIRIAQECGLKNIRTTFTDYGRIPGTARPWPQSLGMKGRLFSDNICMFANK